MELDNLNYRFFRNAIAGVLTALNGKAKAIQVEDSIPKEYIVPIYYDFSNDEQFMRDFFYQMPNWCNVPEHAEGMYEKRPYGTIVFEDFGVVQQEITNRYVRGNFDRLIVNAETGKQAILAYSAYLFNLPLKMSFAGSIKVDSLLQAFSILEGLLSYFYKNNINYFQYNGLRIPLLVSFGDKGSITKKVPINYKEQSEKEIPFSIEVETFYPVFDNEEEGSLRFRGNKIREFYTASKEHQTNEQLSTHKTTMSSTKKFHGTNDSLDQFTFILSSYEGNTVNIIQDVIDYNNGSCYTVTEEKFKKDHQILSVTYEHPNTIVVLDTTLNDNTIELNLYSQ